MTREAICRCSGGPLPVQSCCASNPRKCISLWIVSLPRRSPDDPHLTNRRVVMIGQDHWALNLRTISFVKEPSPGLSSMMIMSLPHNLARHILFAGDTEPQRRRPLRADLRLAWRACRRVDLQCLEA